MDNECNLPEDENDGSDNFNGEPHEVSPANDLEDREGDTGEDKNAEFHLRSVLLNDALTNYGVSYEEKADKGNHRKGKSHVTNQLSPNNLTEVGLNLPFMYPGYTKVIMRQMV